MGNTRKRIETILVAWDFAQAFAVYEAYAPDGFTKDYLRDNTSSFAKSKLEAALRAFLDDPSFEPPDAPPQAAQVPIPIAKMDAVWKPMYKQLAANRLMLRHQKTDAERYKMAVFMLHGWDEVYNIWRDMDYYQARGTMPPPKAPDEPLELDYDTVDRASLVKRRANLRTYLSRNAHNPAKAEKVKEWGNEIDRINELLDNP